MSTKADTEQTLLAGTLTHQFIDQHHFWSQSRPPLDGKQGPLRAGQQSDTQLTDKHLLWP